MHKYNLLSILIPVFSILIFFAAFFLLKPNITGLAVYAPSDAIKTINADVTLSTKSSEIIPPNALVEVLVDGKKSTMTIKDFILKTGKKYEVAKGELNQAKYYGSGFTGDYNYTLTLSDFNIDRSIGKGEHTLKVRIVYRGIILYEKENRLMISG